jgi:hypothetical protein
VADSIARPIVLSEAEGEILERWARRPISARKLAQCRQIVLA